MLGVYLTFCKCPFSLVTPGMWSKFIQILCSMGEKVIFEIQRENIWRRFNIFWDFRETLKLGHVALSSAKRNQNITCDVKAQVVNHVLCISVCLLLRQLI